MPYIIKISKWMGLSSIPNTICRNGFTGEIIKPWRYVYFSDGSKTTEYYY